MLDASHGTYKRRLVLLAYAATASGIEAAKCERCRIVWVRVPHASKQAA